PDVRNHWLPGTSPQGGTAQPGVLYAKAGLARERVRGDQQLVNSGSQGAVGTHERFRALFARIWTGKPLTFCPPGLAFSVSPPPATLVTRFHAECHTPERDRGESAWLEAR
ncbi:uncharacterized protein LOC115565648, partial [Drosophila navojoa]|uniref:uncharacterized protein LOC115565648 n=1 Tax=Drosophila navojoa TaxID=7232 RepID=UPI0011BF3C72